VTFSKRSRADRLGSVTYVVVAICLLVSVIGCGLARFEFSAQDPPAATLLASSVDDIDHADLKQDSLSAAPKPLDAVAPHQRAVPQRSRTLTTWPSWYRPTSWLAARYRFGAADTCAPDVSRTGQKLLTQFCISLR
jgi:hypothetical protein